MYRSNRSKVHKENRHVFILHQPVSSSSAPAPDSCSAVLFVLEARPTSLGGHLDWARPDLRGLIDHSIIIPGADNKPGRLVTSMVVYRLFP